jgi:lipopolysaccharide biosynthesis glycosyltransferase
MEEILNVAYSFDDTYAKYAGISLLSLLLNNQDIVNVSVYIIGEKLKSDNIQKLKKIASDFKREITFLDINDIFPDMGVITSFGKTAYGRLFLSSCLDVDKIFYFDSDTIVSGSIKELLNVNMDNHLIAGVQDTVNPYYLAPIGLNSSDRYINDGGVIILNLCLWRKMKIAQKCVNFIQRFKGNPPHNDQGTINSICKGYIRILPPKYNLMNPMFMFSADKLRTLFKMQQYYSQEQLDEAVRNPVVIHFTTEFFNRPWFKNCTHPLKEVFIDYMKRSPWEIELEDKKLFKNGRIQNWFYYNSPFFVYKMMIRYIELKHRLPLK